MKKMLAPAIAVCMLFHAVTALASMDEMSPVGYWQASDVVGAAFAQRYAFFDDGSFLYGCSEFDGLERVRYEAGEWLVDGGYLVLAVRERLILTGGDLVEDDEFGDRLEGGEVWIETILYPTVEDVYRFAYGAWNRGRCAK